jgi:HD-GYP domain-containing protein (c-di-GMP phosphodiesterase class II)
MPVTSTEGTVSEGMDAVAGQPGGMVADALGSGSADGGDLLRWVAELTCRVVKVDEAAVLLRGRRRELAAVARHGAAGVTAIRATAEGALATGRTLARARSAAAPLTVAGEARGALAVSRATQGRPFTKDDLGLLGDLAAVVAGSLLEHDRLVRAEAALAAGADVLARVVDMRDTYTGAHSAQVGVLARGVGERIGMSNADVAVLDCAARLHDVGKLAVPDAILRKPGPLDTLEWAVMRRHPEWGAAMVAGIPGLEELAELILAHHERWDGHGYPHGLEAGGIPVASRVIAACDAFEAMVSRRPYRAPLSVDEALGELTAGAGSQFDPAVVAAVQVEVAATA